MQAPGGVGWRGLVVFPPGCLSSLHFTSLHFLKAPKTGQPTPAALSDSYTGPYKEGFICLVRIAICSPRGPVATIVLSLGSTYVFPVKSFFERKIGGRNRVLGNAHVIAHSLGRPSVHAGGKSTLGDTWALPSSTQSPHAPFRAVRCGDARSLRCVTPQFAAHPYPWWRRRPRRGAKRRRSHSPQRSRASQRAPCARPPS